MALIDKLVHLLCETALDSPHRAELLFSRLIRGIFAQIAILLGNLGFAQRLVLLSPGSFKFRTQFPGTDSRDNNFLAHFRLFIACLPTVPRLVSKDISRLLDREQRLVRAECALARNVRIMLT